LRRRSCFGVTEYFERIELDGLSFFSVSKTGTMVCLNSTGYIDVSKAKTLIPYISQLLTVHKTAKLVREYMMHRSLSPAGKCAGSDLIESRTRTKIRMNERLCSKR